MEEAAQAIYELRPVWSCAINLTCTHSIYNEDDHRSLGTSYQAWCFPHGHNQPEITVKASSPRELVKKVIEEIFPRLAPRGLPMRSPKPTPSTVVDPAVRPLPGQRTFHLTGPGG